MRELFPEKYNKKLLFNLLIAIVILMVIGFSIAILLFAYQLTSWDISGGFIAALLLTHLLYLLVTKEEDLA